MATPVETPQPPQPPQSPEGPTGAPQSDPSAPEPQGVPGGSPEVTTAPAQAPSGLPGEPAPDGVITSGRGSNADRKPETPTPAAPEDSPSPTEQQAQPPAEPKVDDLPDWAQKIIKEARDDAAKARVNAKQSAADEARKQMAQDIGKALGIITDDTPEEEQLNPEQLRDLLQGERTTARQARVELAVFKAAQGGGGFNASALLDSRAFLDSIKDVDPTDSEKLTEKIAEAVQANPWLASQPTASTEPAAPQSVPGAPAPIAPAAPPVAPPSGGQFAGGPGAQSQDLSLMSIDDFRRMRRNPPRS